MKVSVVVYSKSGNSKMIAKAVCGQLRDRGHEAELHTLEVQGDIHPGVRAVEFAKLPDIDSSDALVLAGPVWAFNASPPLTAYVAKTGKLEGKKALCIVAHALPFSFTGPNRALRKLNQALTKRGAQAAAGIKVHCFGKPSAAKVARVAALACDRLG